MPRDYSAIVSIDGVECSIMIQVGLDAPGQVVIWMDEKANVSETLFHLELLRSALPGSEIRHCCLSGSFLVVDLACSSDHAEVVLSAHLKSELTKKGNR